MRTYVEGVARKENEDPIVRNFAFSIFNRLLTNQDDRDRQAADVNLNKPLLRAGVDLVDKSTVELIYHSTATVSDAIDQISWTLGLREATGFKLFVVREGLELIAGDDDTIVDVLGNRGGPSSSEVQNSQLLFKQEIILLGNLAESDSGRVHLIYMQAKELYLRGDYPIQKEDVVNLCAFQFIAERNPVQDLSQDLIQKLTPQKVIRRQLTV